jgi:hypothetical protein
MTLSRTFKPEVTRHHDTLALLREARHRERVGHYANLSRVLELFVVISLQRGG